VQPQDPAVLLEAEHAVARVLATRPDEPLADSRLLEAIGRALGWDLGAAWEVDDDAMACVATWRAAGGDGDGDGFHTASAGMRLRRGEGLPGRVWASGRPARIDDLGADPNFPRARAARRAGLRCAFAFPVRGARGVIGAVELFAGAPRRADRGLLDTMTSVGRQVGLAADRARGEQALRESVRAGAGDTPAELVERVERAALVHSQGQLRDDLALLAVAAPPSDQ
jgi:GAF domain-containing protein